MDKVQYALKYEHKIFGRDMPKTDIPSSSQISHILLSDRTLDSISNLFLGDIYWMVWAPLLRLEWGGGESELLPDISLKVFSKLLRIFSDALLVIYASSAT